MYSRTARNPLPGNRIKRQRHRDVSTEFWRKVLGLQEIKPGPGEQVAAAFAEIHDLVPDTQSARARYVATV